MNRRKVKEKKNEQLHGNIQTVVTDPYFDADTKAELKKIEGDQAEIEDRFYRQLEFGTGGLRGVIGAEPTV